MNAVIALKLAMRRALERETRRNLMTEQSPPPAAPEDADVALGRKIREAVTALNRLAGDARQQGLTVDLETVLYQLFPHRDANILTVKLSRNIPL